MYSEDLSDNRFRITKYKILRVVALLKCCSPTTRFNIFMILYELPMVLLHEIGHGIPSILHNPSINIYHILKVRYEPYYKHHACYAYLMSCNFDIPTTRYLIIDYIWHFIITIFPPIFIMIILVLLTSLNVWMGVIFGFYMVTTLNAWMLSEMDKYDMTFLFNKIVLLIKFSK